MEFRPLRRAAPLALAALALAACNETSQPTAPQALAPPCRCSEAVPAPPAATVQMPPAPSALVHRRAHHWAYAQSYRSSSWHETETWRETEHASSAEEYGSEAYETDGGYGYRYRSAEELRAAGYEIWIDGYGRRHVVRARDLHEAGWHHAGGDDAARLAPWHGYNGHDGLENGY